MLRKWLFTMKSNLIFFICTALITTCACNGKKGRDLPPVDPVPFERYNADLSFTSKILGTVIKYDILLPEGYEAGGDKRYPVVYCFHGYGDNNNSWNGTYMHCETKIKSLEAEGLEPMIYVFPNGFKTYWCDRHDGTFSYMTMFAEEFVPMIDKTYNTVADRDHRALIGYSMGGFGAMATAMKHPELFSMSAPLSMSFRTDAQYMTESQNGWNEQWGKIFGGWGESGEGRLTEYYKSLCPLHQFTAENKDKYSSVHWFLTCGDNEEQLLIANDDLHVMMRDNGYSHEYRVWDGGHSTSYWRGALEEVLPWFSSLMAGNTAWQKTLKEVDLSEECRLNSEGVYESSAYVNAGRKEGTAIYLFHEGLADDILTDAMSILQRGMDNKKIVIFPCDTRRKSASEWVSYFKDLYPAGSSQAIAVGGAGQTVFKCKELFSALYFDNAFLGKDISADKERFYYIGQSDDGPEYESSNALYKSCKKTGSEFEYRCRNQLDDSRLDLLTGFEYIKMNYHNL